MNVDQAEDPRGTLARLVDETCSSQLSTFLATVPSARHLSDASTRLDPVYYVRHRIETVHRIRLTSRLDALALASMVEEDYDAARLWSRYLTDELHHDLLFLADLREMGWSAAAVGRVAPFASTVQMVDGLIAEIPRVGGLAAVAYSLFVEWNSERASGAVVERAAEQFGAHAVAGARRHLGIDADADHYSLMLDIAARLLRGRHPNVVIDLTHRIAAHLRTCFAELHDWSGREPRLRAGFPSPSVG